MMISMLLLRLPAGEHRQKGQSALRACLPATVSGCAAISMPDCLAGSLSGATDPWPSPMQVVSPILIFSGWNVSSSATAFYYDGHALDKRHPTLRRRKSSAIIGMARDLILRQALIYTRELRPKFQRAVPAMSRSGSAW